MDNVDIKELKPAAVAKRYRELEKAHRELVAKVQSCKDPDLAAWAKEHAYPQERAPVTIVIQSESLPEPAAKATGKDDSDAGGGEDVK